MEYAAAAQLWQKALSYLRADMNDVSYQTWCSELKLYSANNGNLILYTDNRMFLDTLKRRYTTKIGMAVFKAFGEDYNVQIIHTEELSRFSDETPNSKLNPRYTFDTFVVGQSNKFAHSACLAVAEQPGSSYNPLFIYGGVGLGKTHLMNAIAWFILDMKKDSRILFTTSENFTNEVVDAIARKKTPELRQRMRNVDVLLVDDVQFLANRQATQEEFFNTFNALYENNKQIVLSSDRPPHEIKALEDRMKSRFLSGLVVDVQKPDFETRMAILMRMAEQEQIRVGQDIIAFIAESIDTNIRELEGSLNRVNALAKTEGVPITLELAQTALKGISVTPASRSVTPETIIDAVALRYRITREDILSNRRNREVAVPRQLAIYLTRELAQMSTTNIGTSFGRDHSTILHACQKTAQSIATDRDFAQTVEELIQSLIGR